MKIPFNRPYLTGKEIKYIKDSLNRRKLSGDGYYTKKVNEFIENTFYTPKALLTTSGSTSLDMAALLLNLQPEDEIILPSYTFVSTANAVLLRGAKIIFADIDPKTMNIDPAEIEKKITPHTKAIFVVHYAGISCDMDKIMKIAKQHNLKVVEDAAQGVNAKYKDKYLGSIGDLGPDGADAGHRGLDHEPAARRRQTIIKLSAGATIQLLDSESRVEPQRGALSVAQGSALGACRRHQALKGRSNIEIQ